MKYALLLIGMVVLLLVSLSTMKSCEHAKKVCEHEKDKFQFHVPVSADACTPDQSYSLLHYCENFPEDNGKLWCYRHCLMDKSNMDCMHGGLANRMDQLEHML